MPSGRSSFVNAWSEDGCNFKVDSKPSLTPADHKDFFKYVEWGIEDARVVKIENKFYITYTGYSKYMPLVILTETENFKDFNIIGPSPNLQIKIVPCFLKKLMDTTGKLIAPPQKSEEISGLAEVKISYTGEVIEF
jgi:predicted GH43/DUF377 family glycosyl hydrolase